MSFIVAPLGAVNSRTRISPLPRPATEELWRLIVDGLAMEQEVLGDTRHVDRWASYDLLGRNSLAGSIADG
jgi:hypothetical protein